MKKLAVSIVLSAVLCFPLFTLVGCADYYKVPENHCIVGLYKDYRLYFETERAFCTPIDQKIKEIETIADYNYYSVMKGAEYTLCIDDFIDNDCGWGVGTEGDVRSAYWQGNIITEFVMEYRNETRLQEEAFFTTDFKNMDCEIAVSFHKNCTVKAVTEPYLYVGGIYEIAEKDGNLLHSKINEYLNTDGSFNERDGFYYLMLENEVRPYQDAWKTNLDITGYNLVSIEGDRTNAVSAQFTCKPLTVSENRELWLHITCRTYSGKYFTYPLIYVGTLGFAVPVREHELRLDFDFNQP